MTIITSGTITGQNIDILSGELNATLETPAQPNITSVGTLSNLIVSGTVQLGPDLSKLMSQTLSVGTSWVNIPLSQKRGAFLILASSIGNDDSCLVAAATDDSNFDVGNINVLSVSRDYTTTNQLELQWVTNDFLQIRMSAGNTRDVSIMVIRA